MQFSFHPCTTDSSFCVFIFWCQLLGNHANKFSLVSHTPLYYALKCERHTKQYEINTPLEHARVRLSIIEYTSVYKYFIMLNLIIMFTSVFNNSYINSVKHEILLYNFIAKCDKLFFSLVCCVRRTLKHAMHVAASLHLVSQREGRKFVPPSITLHISYLTLLTLCLMSVFTNFWTRNWDIILQTSCKHEHSEQLVNIVRAVTEFNHISQKDQDWWLDECRTRLTYGWTDKWTWIIVGQIKKKKKNMNQNCTDKIKTLNH